MRERFVSTRVFKYTKDIQKQNVVVFRVSDKFRISEGTANVKPFRSDGFRLLKNGRAPLRNDRDGDWFRVTCVCVRFVVFVVVFVSATLHWPRTRGDTNFSNRLKNKNYVRYENYGVVLLVYSRRCTSSFRGPGLITLCASSKVYRGAND